MKPKIIKNTFCLGEIPHNGGEIAFEYPGYCVKASDLRTSTPFENLNHTKNYNYFEQKIKENKLKKASSSQIASLLFDACSKCDYTFFCGGDCRGSAYGNSKGKDIKAPVPYCNERKDSLREMFNILSLNPNFMKNKSRRIIENAREETMLYEKS